MRLLLDIFRQMLRTLWAHKLRSFLTMFGIAWGVGSLLLLVGIGEGFRSAQKRNMQMFGQNIMFLFPGRTPAIPGQFNSMHFYRLTYEDFEAIREQAHLVGAVCPLIGRGDVRAVSEFNSIAGGVTGVGANYPEIRFTPMLMGRWIDEGDDRERRRVAVIGNDAMKQLFPGRPVLGSTILLNGSSFEVVGVTRAVGRDQNSGTNTRIFIPIRTMMMLFPLKSNQEKNAISYINYHPRLRQEHAEAKEEVHRIVGTRHHFDWKVKDAFEDDDSVQEEETISRIWDAMDWFLGGVGLVTLGLGAIGVINIMLVSVTERTREIGLRKALGARRRDVLVQFFLEGAFITAFSGSLGVAGTAALMYALHFLPAQDMFDPPSLGWLSAGIAVGALALAGTASGIYPARKAALLTPVEALRQET